MAAASPVQPATAQKKPGWWSMCLRHSSPPPHEDVFASTSPAGELGATDAPPGDVMAEIDRRSASGQADKAFHQARADIPPCSTDRDAHPEGLLDEPRLEELRRLCEEEAHTAASSRLIAYKEELRASGDSKALEQLTSLEDADEPFRRMRWKVKKIAELFEALGDARLTDNPPQSAQNPVHSRLGTATDNAEMWGCMEESSGNSLTKISASFEMSTEQLVALFYEADLYPQWLPHVWEAKYIHSVEGCGKYAQFVAVVKYALPWPLQQREAVLFGFGSDLLDESGRIILFAESVPEDATEWWGYPLPPAGKSMRVYAKFCLSFIALPPSPEGKPRVKLDKVLVTNPKVDWLPRGWMSMMQSLYVKQMFRGVSSIAHNFETSKYIKRVKDDERGFYTFLADCLRRYGESAATKP